MGGKRTNARRFGEDGKGEGKARGRKEKKWREGDAPPHNIWPGSTPDLTIKR